MLYLYYHWKNTSWVTRTCSLHDLFFASQCHYPTAAGLCSWKTQSPSAVSAVGVKPSESGSLRLEKWPQKRLFEWVFHMVLMGDHLGIHGLYFLNKSCSLDLIGFQNLTGYHGMDILGINAWWFYRNWELNSPKQYCLTSNYVYATKHLE